MTPADLDALAVALREIAGSPFEEPFYFEVAEAADVVADRARIQRLLPWVTCPTCGGTTITHNETHEWNDIPCSDCKDGKVQVSIEDLVALWQTVHDYTDDFNVSGDELRGWLRSVRAEVTL